MVRIRRGPRILLAPELCAAGEEPLVQLIRSRAANGPAAWLIISRGATVAPMTKPAASGTVVTSHHLLAGLRAPSLRRRQAELGMLEERRDIAATPTWRGWALVLIVYSSAQRLAATWRRARARVLRPL